MNRTPKKDQTKENVSYSSNIKDTKKEKTKKKVGYPRSSKDQNYQVIKDHHKLIT